MTASLKFGPSTESPVYTQMAAARSAGIDSEHVIVHVTNAGGSFGLHSSSRHDPTSEAVQVAKALNWQYPIKLQSSREEEFKSGRYRAMAVHRVRAATDSSGRLTAFHHQIAAQPTSPNLPFVGDVLFSKGVDFMTTTGAVDPPYAFTNFRLESTNVDSGVPIMVWRSVGNSHTEFARESALDELAIAGNRDPIDLRRDLLTGTPRTLRALEVAAELVLGIRRPPKVAREGLLAVASSATAPSSSKSRGTNENASTCNASPSSSTAGSRSIRISFAHKLKAGSSMRSVLRLGARSRSATAAISSPRISIAILSCASNRFQRSTCI